MSEKRNKEVHRELLIFDYGESIVPFLGSSEFKVSMDMGLKWFVRDKETKTPKHLKLHEHTWN